MEVRNDVPTLCGLGEMPAATSASTMLSARSVFFSWGEHQVLEDFSLDVERGSVVCLMGVNGCGKSTFLDCVLGENRPDTGTVKVNGKDVVDMRARERARLLAYVPQIHERMFPYTVEHMVLMGRTAYQSGFGSTDDEDRCRVLEALRTCGIDHLHGRVCTELSGGEMQMALLARALVQDTPLIVLDEPTAHLDFKNELVFLETVERLVSAHGVTVLMATHAPNQAFHLAAAGLDVRVALMSCGRVACVGVPDEVLTPSALWRYFGVRAALAHVSWVDDSSPGYFADGQGTVMRQVVPLSTSGDQREEARE